MNDILYTGTGWSWDKLHQAYDAIEKISTEELKLDTYPNIFEIIRPDQMLDAYSSHGMPQMYEHWSFGKNHARDSKQYKQGHMGLAMEIVVNVNPCINYLMEDNTMTCQALTMSHAGCGHNSFFKNNYLFKQWTHADSIIDYLAFARKYIKKMEEQHGEDAVERIIDLAKSLEHNGMDRYPKPRKRSLKEEIELENNRHDHYEKNYDDISKLISKKKKIKSTKDQFLPDGPEENLLYFLEKKSPVLKPWQREILRIIRKIAQYYRPQMGSQVSNEGWASTVHYYIMNRLWDTGQIDNSSAMEFLDLHTAVVRQIPFDHPAYSGFNPYYLGFNIFAEIKRISENPTEEDKYWLPHHAGRDWLENWHNAMENYRDDSLIQQFLTPNLIRKFRLFTLNNNNDDKEWYHISSIHNEKGYHEIRNNLADNYNVMKKIPDIQVTYVDFDTRICYLTHYADDGVLLGKDAQKVLENFKELWGFDCVLETRNRLDHELLKEYTTGA